MYSSTAKQLIIAFWFYCHYALEHKPNIDCSHVLIFFLSLGVETREQLIVDIFFFCGYLIVDFFVFFCGYLIVHIFFFLWLPRSNTHARKRPFTALNGDIRRS
jgi:hypothetical protein